MFLVSILEGMLAYRIQYVGPYRINMKLLLKEITPAEASETGMVSGLSLALFARGLTSDWVPGACGNQNNTSIQFYLSEDYLVIIAIVLFRNHHIQTKWMLRHLQHTRVTRQSKHLQSSSLFLTL